ncbi:CheB methylesterase domain-containing protein [Salipiger sp. P9]|uniref:CheB methylesterase domain-containing protein n=1 Tax=Salipiger pentaromativorans TaxID=2943193 RepID=UPI002157AA6C|nr:CheB methylesterase domain-containing protein [Salipiger pentaromativorans]MCR8549799.1 CheB methylesterase domain-containing protein [Salipiger pentaromativorans]
MRPISLIIAIPDRALRRRLSQEMGASPVIDVVAETHDLMTTYAEVEEREPMAVLIAGALARAPEFEVMRALFAALDVRWLVITGSPDAGGRDADSPWGRTSDLFAVDTGVSAERLVETLRSVTRAARRLGPATAPPAALRPAAAPEAPAAGRSNRFILIGASTGGVDALLCVLSSFPADCPPTFIVQHTGGGFGESLTRLLDRQCAARVRPARDGDTVDHGEIVLAAGSRAHMRLAGGKPMRIALEAGAPISGHMPSVDALFHSAVPGARRAVVALLTGMGRDGAEGMKALRDAGAVTIAQDKATSIVYGMPRAAMQIGAAQSSLALPRIGPALLRACAAGQTQASQRATAK